VTLEERLQNAADRERELSELPEHLIKQFAISCSSALNLQSSGPSTGAGQDPVDTLFLDDGDLELENDR
jgi:hypothetical protein